MRPIGFSLPLSLPAAPVLAEGRAPGPFKREISALLRNRAAIAVASITTLGAGAGLIALWGEDDASPSQPTFLVADEPRQSFDQRFLKALRAKGPENFTITVDPASFSVNTYENYSEAITAFTEMTSADVLGVGEYHDLPSYPGAPPWQFFHTHILGGLKNAGFGHLVLERILSDFPDATAPDSKIRQYIEELTKIAPRRAQRLDSTLALARTQKMSVSGGNVSLREGKRLLPRVEAGDEDAIIELRTRIRDISLAAIRKAASSGKRVIFYGGQAHVPTHPALLGPATYNDSAMGEILINEGYDYVGLQIEDPSFIMVQALAQQGPNNSIDRTLIQPLWFLDRHGFIPPAGKVNLLKLNWEHGDMYYLVLPYSF